MQLSLKNNNLVVLSNLDCSLFYKTQDIDKYGTVFRYLFGSYFLSNVAVIASNRASSVLQCRCNGLLRR